MFIDEAKICLVSGPGGHGSMSFRREKHRPKGGPDGGDGGDGGDVILRANPKIRTLQKFTEQIHWKAERGQRGASNDRRGRKGKPMVVDVPVGTVVKQLHTQEVLADLQQPKQKVKLAHGGEGGRGNVHFKSSTRQAPHIYEKGEPGEELWVKLELKILADVGLVGVPNAGKSTLLSTFTNKQPKIAAYPFTTLAPHLGTVKIDDERDFVIVDIPGLISGAHGGKGLGDRFLKHVERTQVLVHVIDASGWEDRDPIEDYHTLNAELEAFAPQLVDKPQIVVGNKIDLMDETARARIERRFRDLDIEPIFVSAVQREGLSEVIQACERTLRMMEEQSEAGPEPVPEPEPQVYQPEPAEPTVRVIRDEDGFIVEGPEVERLARLNVDEPDAVAYLQDQLDELGVFAALRREGAQEGDPVHLAGLEFEYQPD
ncbi:MAG: GTPase ObgE [Candidatus Bipolaricaulia bacterium]